MHEIFQTSRSLKDLIYFSMIFFPEFHKKCVRGWILFSEKERCCLCRSSISSFTKSELTDAVKQEKSFIQSNTSVSNTGQCVIWLATEQLIHFRFVYGAIFQFRRPQNTRVWMYKYAAPSGQNMNVISDSSCWESIPLSQRQEPLLFKGF